MQVAFIHPTPLTHVIGSLSKYHMVLGHIFAENEEYRRFYCQKRVEGDFILLDNSAYELGEGIAIEKLVDCAAILKPDAIFLPDVRFNKDATIERSISAREKLSGLGFDPLLLAVPQGSNATEVIACYDTFNALDWIGGFGIYEEIGEVTGFGDRAGFLRYLQRTSRVDYNKHYHLLGMEENVNKVEKLATYPWVAGIDSVKPIVYGMNKIAVSGGYYEGMYPHRPEGYFDLSCDEEQQRYIVGNCKVTQTWARGR